MAFRAETRFLRETGFLRSQLASNSLHSSPPSLPQALRLSSDWFRPARFAFGGLMRRAFGERAGRNAEELSADAERQPEGVQSSAAKDAQVQREAETSNVMQVVDQLAAHAGQFCVG